MRTQPQKPGVNHRAASVAFVDALAYSWTLEKLRPGDACIASSYSSCAEITAASTLDNARVPFPDWRSPVWRCAEHRGVDLEFQAAMTGAAAFVAHREWVPSLIGAEGATLPQLSELALSLHRATFGQVWEEAGRFRSGNFNVGVSWTFVPEAMLDLDALWPVWVQTCRPREAAMRRHVLRTDPPLP